MKNVKAQISLAVVCSLLGFMIAYQFKIVQKRSENLNVSSTNPEILTEIQQLKKEKKDLETKINELQYKIRQYENETVGKDEIDKKLKKELDSTRVYLGETDVEGQGIILYIKPRSDFFNFNNEILPVNDRDLLYVVNELYSGGAEAIAINDIRITATSGIRNAGNVIRIDNQKISPVERVVIKAIGNKKTLQGTIDFVGSIPETLTASCDVKYEPSDKIKIKKTNKVYDFKYSKTVEDKKE